MRIAHVTATFPPYYAGTGLVCYHNALELARRGHQVTVFTAAYPRGDYDYPEEITVKRLPVLFRFGNAPFLPDLLKIRDVDIIHLHYPFIFGAELIWLVSRLRKIPYVITHHNDLMGDGSRRYLFDAYSNIFGRLVFQGANKYAVVSLSHAADCRMTPFFKARWNDVIEVPNGVDVKLFCPGLDGDAIRCRYEIGDHSKVILFVGALDRAHHFKGLGYLLEAFSRIETPDAILLIVGDGELKEHFISRAHELGASGRVYFTGSIRHQDIPPYFAAADVLVLPSFPPESFGMVILESFACGTPVIASDLPGVRTVISPGEDGFLVSPGDAGDLAEKLARILSLPEDERRSMGSAGRHEVEERYAWNRIGDKLEGLYLGVFPVNSIQASPRGGTVS